MSVDGNKMTSPELQTLRRHIQVLEDTQKQFQTESNLRFTHLEGRLGKMEIAFNNLSDHVKDVKEDMKDVKKDMGDNTRETISTKAWIKGSTATLILIVPILSGLVLFIFNSIRNGG